MTPREQKHGRSNGAPGGFPSFAARLCRIAIALACAVSGVLVLGHSSPPPEQGEANSEYRLKLAFLYNFAQFVQWPAEAFTRSDAPLVICVEGDNPFQGEIEQSLRGRAVGGHPIQLRKMLTEDDLHTCQIVFVRSAQMKEAPQIFARSKNLSVLTVGETNGFAERGGIINLRREENRLRFEVNIDAAAQSRLKISSKLLALAKIVKE